MSQNWSWISWIWLLLMSVFASESLFKIWPYSLQKAMFNHVVLKYKRDSACCINTLMGLFFSDICRKSQVMFLLMINILQLFMAYCYASF